MAELANRLERSVERCAAQSVIDQVEAPAAGVFGDVIRDAVQGQAGLDALTAMLTAARAYVTAHPGRYTATTGAGFDGPDDPLLVASTRVVNTIAAVLRGYGVSDAEMNHAIRTVRCTLHGFAMLEASGGFQWDADPDESFDWMIRFIDRGLRPA